MGLRINDTIPNLTVETDQGEGRFVVIRGMDPDLNATSINGLRAAATEPRRAMQLDVIPSDVLDGLEIAKTLTADMDADAIGGSINVKTLSAFSRFTGGKVTINQRFITVTGAHALLGKDLVDTAEPRFERKRDVIGKRQWRSTTASLSPIDRDKIDPAV